MKWPDTFSLYLVDNLDKESEKELYVKALMYYTNKSRSSEYYLILRTYLTEEERIAFVDKQKNGYDLKFYVDMLKIEKRYADILEIAKNENTYYTNYLYVLNPIVNIYPDECFEIIKKECNAAMSSPKRNRNTYERITDLLNVMLKIISKQNEALLYIKALYNYKPNLPALKDELRKRLGGKYFF
ncbi:MAG: hypothetical protein BWY38_03235 [Ignavibacteria bacterium ADurb.Bin266]|nr:MAG: hypothetical protein BWY38_03235 [Ignavibacteria bacterium ADurb.Bin266]